MATNTTRLGLRKPEGTDLVQVSLDVSASMDKLDSTISAVCTSSTRPSTPFVGMRAYETDTNAQIVCLSTGPSVWRYITSPIIVSSAAARTALSPKHEGMTVYRTDKDFVEIWDGAAWRVRNMVTVGALADITDPYDDQVVLLGSDNSFYRWSASGSSWVNNVLSSRFVGRSKPGSPFTVTTTEQIAPDVVTGSVVNGNIYEMLWTVRFTIATGSPTSWSLRPRVQSGGSLTTGGTAINADDYIGPPPSGAWQTNTYMASWTATFTGTASFGFGVLTNASATLTLPANGRVLTVKDVT